MKPEELKKQEDLKRLLDDKIDQYNKQTFPASDAPQWDSLQGLDQELKDLKESTSRDEEKPSSENPH